MLVMQPNKCIQKLDADRQEADVASGIDLMFRAFSDRTRLRILCLLRRREFCVGDIVAILQLPQPRISRHLAYLRKAGLVKARKSGHWCYYSLAPGEAAFHKKLVSCLNSCFADVPQVHSDLGRAAQLRDSGGCCPPS